MRAGAERNIKEILKHMRTILAAVGVTAALAATPFAAQAEGLVRHALPEGHFPIAAAIEVPPGYTTVYLSGMGAAVADAKAAPMTLAAYGNTETQTRSALAQIEKALTGLGLSFADVVQMHVYLKPDPATGKLDFPGMMKAYTEKFGTKAQPDLPTRSAFGVATLANPGWLVEIEVTAVRKPK